LEVFHLRCDHSGDDDFASGRDGDTSGR
jgi:hypothetical protein